MPKKKGLGRDIEKSMEVMEDLMDCLGKFHSIPVKKGLKTNGIIDDKYGKSVNDAKEKASALHGIVEDLLDQVKRAKPEANKRFACQRIISKFLTQS